MLGGGHFSGFTSTKRLFGRKKIELPTECAPHRGEEERIKSLSSLINNQVQKLSEKIGQLGEARMILLASLVLLDKSDEVEKEAEKVISITSEKIEKLAKKFSNE